MTKLLAASGRMKHNFKIRKLIGFNTILICQKFGITALLRTRGRILDFKNVRKRL